MNLTIICTDKNEATELASRYNIDLFEDGEGKISTGHGKEITHDMLNLMNDLEHKGISFSLTGSNKVTR